MQAYHGTSEISEEIGDTILETIMECHGIEPKGRGGSVYRADVADLELTAPVAKEPKAAKTTSLMAGVSMIAIASVHGLMFSANATETAFEAMAVKASGAAMVPDDSGASKRSADDEQRQIYQYANQMGRGRGTTTGGLQELNSWNGAMGISTERGLLTRLDAEGADAKSGVQSRVFTVNFENSETLDKTEDADLLAAYDVLAHGAKPTVENGVFGVAWKPFVLPALSATSVTGLIWLGLIGAAATYALWFRGVARLEPSAVSMLGMMSPVTAVVLGWVYLGQTLSLTQSIGAAIVIGSVVVGQSVNRRDNSGLKKWRSATAGSV